MDRRATLERRLRSHRLMSGAATVADAAAHMLAVQAQEFWGGRWALGIRTRGATTAADVHAAFDDGVIVRAWTMRGTLHIVPAADLEWLLSLTRERQLRQAAARHRQLGLDEATLARAETIARSALGGGGRLTRAEMTEALARGGVDTAGQRGIHVLQVLALRAVTVSGPIVPRESAPAREQYFVLAEEWVRHSAAPTDPAAEMFTRFIASHGPASVRDFAWWSGLTLGASRAAADAASDLIVPVTDGVEPMFVAAGDTLRRRPGLLEVLALPPFDEYYLSYADRATASTPDVAAAVGPSKNGMVRPMLLARGHVVGVWSHSSAVGRHRDPPVADLLVPGSASDAEVASALARYAAFIGG